MLVEVGGFRLAFFVARPSGLWLHGSMKRLVGSPRFASLASFLIVPASLPLVAPRVGHGEGVLVGEGRLLPRARALARLRAVLVEAQGERGRVRVEGPEAVLVGAPPRQEAARARAHLRVRGYA